MEENNSLRAGNDVKIMQEKRTLGARTNNPFYQTYGRILSIYGNRAKVIFPNEFIIHFGVKMLPIEEFPLYELQAFALENNPDIARKRQSSPFEYTFTPLAIRFDSSSRCMCKDCNEFVYRRIVYGSPDGKQIAEYDVCKKHSKLENQKGDVAFNVYALQDA